jgi:hypothetical protein
MNAKPDMRRTRTIVITLLFIAGVSALSHAQFDFFRMRVPQNNPPPTELVIARWRFSTNGNINHMGWSHNYPNAEMHLNQLVSETTLVNVAPESYRIVDLGSPEVFQYPFAYVSEPGEMELTEPEFVNLREYIDRGGFIIVDDFDGAWQWDQFYRQMRRAFPDRGLVRLTGDEEVFRTFYEIKDLTIWEPYVPGADPIFYGFHNSRGDIAMVVCFNNDFANFWDWIDNGRYPLKPSSEAFRMGINFVIYAKTH